ncbi:MAG: 4-alpha-glucanotransferase [Oscillospiraceae bacterium]|nr:4-alpha-glucanotransferase [Oscillospiraceae bacterium]
MVRESGILMPMSSLPSPYGIGTMGKSAYRFVDFLKAAGQKYWQLLPLGPTSYGDSPYSSFSTFAGNPYYIDLDLLVKDGLLRRGEITGRDWGEDPERVDYGRIYEHRFEVLRLAYARGKEKLADEVAAFRQENAAWLEDYALFMAVKRGFGMVSWVEWPDEAIRLHKPEAVDQYRRELADDVDFWCFLQFLFFRQWKALRAYAHDKGIDFIGDVPIYVALDSADVWSAPRFFQLDENNLPTEVAGCPPDAFTEDGQLWGNPLYDWDKMKADGFGWWIRRIEGAEKLFDVIRIDHFRGFESYWAVPYGDKTARRGRWRPGPGMDLVGVLTSWFHKLRFIAEDLGFMTPEVKKLLADSGLPGMKVLEFGFDAKGESDYMPHNCVNRSVCYVGTHDNEVVNGWLKSTDRATLRYAADYMHKTADESWCWAMIRTGMSTASQLFVMQMQDVLELPASARVNCPGTATGNWQWRMRPDAIDAKLARKIRRCTETYRRLP